MQGLADLLAFVVDCELYHMFAADDQLPLLKRGLRCIPLSSAKYPLLRSSRRSTDIRD